MKHRNITAILLGLAWFALLPGAQAVSPAPDGGYPGGNTAEGQSALLSLTTGTYNTAVGLFSLRSNTSGILNTSVGAGALLANTGNENTALGAGALFSNITGTSDTANGAFALFSNTSGYFNTANGDGTLFSNIDGFNNTANGFHALYGNIHGFSNTANGVDALVNNTEGNTNTANGVSALFSNTTGGDNTAVGLSALHDNTTGDLNTALGITALFSNTDGVSNTAVGYQSLYNLSAGSYNIALEGGFNLTTGNFNIYIGNDGEANESGAIRIGSTCCQDSGSTYIAGIWGWTFPGQTAVYVNEEGHLGVAVSSARFKRDIQDMDKASEAILALKPVTFHYKKEIDPHRMPQFGLVAEDVEAVNPDLVVRAKEGKAMTVRYEAVNAMLLNEFLKEHRRVEEQGCEVQEEKSTISQLKITLARQDTIIAQQQKEIETVVARLKEQESKIQRVSHQVEMSKFATRRIRRGGPAPRMVLNP